jgi:WD40 repeat protein
MSLTSHLEYRGVAMSGGSYPDDTLKLWDSIDIQREQPYKRLADVGEQDSITALCPLPGRKIITGDENGMIWLWNLDRNTCECVVHAHSTVRSLSSLPAAVAPTLVQDHASIAGDGTFVAGSVKLLQTADEDGLRV